MITWSFVGVLFWIFFIPSRAYLLWINYKARFRYGLREHSPFWRKLDQTIGVGSILVDFVVSILVVFVLSAVLILLLDISAEVSMTTVLFGGISWTFVNLATDKISIDSFEKKCLRCRHKKECVKFLEQNCSIESLKQRAKSAERHRDT
jgi:hypothetical protein